MIFKRGFCKHDVMANLKLQGLLSVARVIDSIVQMIDSIATGPKCIVKGYNVVQIPDNMFYDSVTCVEVGTQKLYAQILSLKSYA